MATHSLPGLRRRLGGPVVESGEEPRLPGRSGPDPEPERHWRDDPRMLRAYALADRALGRDVRRPRASSSWLLYLQSEHDVTALGTVSLLLGLPVTAVEVVVTLWVVARLHRHRCPGPASPPARWPIG